MRCVLHDMLATLLLAAGTTASGATDETPVAILMTGVIDVHVEGDEEVRSVLAPGVTTFTWDRDGEALIVTSSEALVRHFLDGSPAETIVAGLSEPRFPEVSPDGQLIAFAAKAPIAEDETKEAWHVFTVRRDGTQLLEVCRGYDPSFDRTGSRLFFEDYAPRADLYSISIFGGTAKRLLAPGDRYTVRALRDGRTILFSSRGGLFEADLVNGSERELTDGKTYDRFPSLHPDGSRIVFMRDGGAGSTIVERSLVDGGERLIRNTDEQGRPALAEYAPARQRTLADFEDSSPTGDALVLEGVYSLTREEAAALAGSKRRRLSLPDVTHLDAAIAAELARFPGSLSLNGLRDLRRPAATALSAWSGNGERIILSLDGLTAPAPEVLGELARSHGWGFSFGGIENLTPELARGLRSARFAHLQLGSVTAIDSATATEMSNWDIKFLKLDGLRELSPESRQLVESGCAVLLTRGL